MTQEEMKYTHYHIEFKNCSIDADYIIAQELEEISEILKIVDSEIINRKMCSIANFGHGGKMMKFCSGECAAHEQYSLEG